MAHCSRETRSPPRTTCRDSARCYKPHTKKLAEAPGLPVSPREEHSAARVAAPNSESVPDSSRGRRPGASHGRSRRAGALRRTTYARPDHPAICSAAAISNMSTVAVARSLASTSVARRTNPLTGAARRSRAFRATRRPTRLAASARVMAMEGDEMYEDDVDYSGNLCMFLDSASEEEWAKWLPSGIFTGVTTNPIILERDGRECNIAALTDLAKQALEYDAVQEFQVQTWGESSDEMWKNGIALAKYDPDVIVVKVPGTFEGIKAANALVADGIRVTITAAYASHQAVLAAAVGANYVAPYLGRMNDAGRDGFGTIVEMQKTADKLDSDMRILVASVRNVGDIAKLAAQGCDTFTVSAAIAEAMFADPLTTQASADFEAAAERIGAYVVVPAEAAKEANGNESEGGVEGASD